MHITVRLDDEDEEREAQTARPPRLVEKTKKASIVPPDYVWNL